MATFRIDALGETPARLRSWLDRARRAASGRPAASRLGLLAVMAGGLAVAGCLAVWSVAPAERVALASGRHFRRGDLEKVERELRLQGIEFKIDGDRSVSVPGRSAEAANAILAKLDLGPRTPDQLRDASAAASSWLESPRDKEERALRDRAKILETMIDEFEGVDEAFVSINRDPSRGLRQSARSRALVRVQTVEGRELPFSSVESIVSMLISSEPSLTRESLTVIDGEGHRYLDAGNPALTARSNNRAREEDLTRRIHDELTWIKDVRVTVKVEDAPAAETPAEAPPSRKPAAATASAGLSVGLNRAMELVDDEPPAPEADAARVQAPRRRGEVWILVPRSYYYNAGLMPEGRQSSQDDRVALMGRTETMIRKAVGLAVPESDPIDWAPTVVDVYPDQLPVEHAVASGVSSSRRTAREWAMAGAAGAAAAALVAIGTWILGGRQPARRSSPSRGGLRYHRGTPGTPAPTERVLEFVRRNPETAFSVLNRWTAQGGGRS